MTFSPLGPTVLGVLATVVAGVEEGAGAGATGHGRPLASGRAAGMVVPSIEAATGQTTHRRRPSSPDSADGHGQPLWGAPRIHGELLKLGMVVSERTVSRYLPDRGTTPSQTWRTFLANHLVALASTSSVAASPPGDFVDAPDAWLRLTPSICDRASVIDRRVVVEWRPSFQRPSPEARVAQDPRYRKRGPANKDPPNGPNGVDRRMVSKGYGRLIARDPAA